MDACMSNFEFFVQEQKTGQTTLGVLRQLASVQWLEVGMRRFPAMRVSGLQA
jgi:hypothetical protein